MSEKILFIQRTQFGYLTDTLKIARALSNSHSVHFVCFDVGRIKNDPGRISLHYIERSGNLLCRSYIFFRRCIEVLKEHRPDKIVIQYFPFCSIIPFFVKGDFIVDFRTASVRRNALLRVIMDYLSSLEARRFSKLSVISSGIRDRLNLPKDRTVIIPLGADEISNIPKSFRTLNLFYIGTLSNRRVFETVIGLALFLRFNPHFYEKVSYDIVGDGSESDILKIRQCIDHYRLGCLVKLRGRLTHEEARQFFDKCNVGVSYVPITPYYDRQPPTKTYEYVRSGLAVIATSTSANAEIIDNQNGVLCADNPEGFADGLERMTEKFRHFDDGRIRATCETNSWDSVIQEWSRHFIR